ncbi:hypothetical protein ACRALDRAFT_2032212 [Sodiomyces alcalophilus JCM 7366]|uniref:uncharacterized protein n=1 Tax=Sodiomyces alcalophilus JCM 7366 TaxID=591952 RepID=UPI0039B650F1
MSWPSQSYTPKLSTIATPRSSEPPHASIEQAIKDVGGLLCESSNHSTASGGNLMPLTPCHPVREARPVCSANGTENPWWMAVDRRM